MKNLLLLVLVSASFNLVAADILYLSTEGTTSLKKAYDKDDSEELSDFYESFSSFDGSKVDPSLMCVKSKKKAKVVKELDKLNDKLEHWLFEDHSISATVNLKYKYPVALTLTDEPNESEVGTVYLKFCD